MSDSERKFGAIWGSFIGDAHAMPVHWYYDRGALKRDYGFVTDYVEPRNPHADSILWRSSYTPLNERGEILHDQARFWGHPGVHYHQQLKAGENTLNLQLACLLLNSLRENGGYDADDYLDRYIDFMTRPGSHKDTYIEEYHRNFFTNFARGKKPRACGQPDIHIGGLAHVGILCAWFADDVPRAREIVGEHVGLTHPDPSLLRAADSFTRVLCGILSGLSVRRAIAEYGTDHFSEKRAQNLCGRPDEVVVGKVFSPACYIQDAYPATLYLAWKYADNFLEGIIANTNVGGDNCHRGAVLGAILGAANRLNRIPAHLIEGLRAGGFLEGVLQLDLSPTGSQ